MSREAVFPFVRRYYPIESCVSFGFRQRIPKVVEFAMEVEYELTAADVKAYLRFQTRRCPKPKPHPLARVILLGLGVAIGVLLSFSSQFSTEPTVKHWVTVFCSGALAGVLGMVALLFLLAKLGEMNTIRHYFLREECRWLLARRRLRIGVDGFEITNEFQQARCSWSAVWLIDSTDEYAFFFTSFNNAQVIPRSAFRADRHFEEFIDLACRYHKGLPPRRSASTEILDALPAEQTGITLPRQS